MRALTLHRPWPFVILRCGKRVENRPWAPYKAVIGERIALHAGKGWDMRAEQYIEPDMTRGGRWPVLAYAEGLVGTAVVAGWVNGAVPWEPGEAPWHPGSARKHRYGPETLAEDLALEAISSPFYFGPFGWVLEDVREFSAPIPCRGFQGLWNVPEELCL